MSYRGRECSECQKSNLRGMRNVKRKFEMEFVIDVVLNPERGRGGRYLLGMSSGELEKKSCSCDRRNLISSLQFILKGG